MANLIHNYYKEALSILDRILKNEEKNIKMAATKIAERIRDGEIVFVFGTGGHSIMGAEEMFYRAGGLQPINAMLDVGVSLTQGATHSTLVERTPNYARTMLDYYGVGKNDVIIIVNVNGINSMTIESAMGKSTLFRTFH